MSDPAAERRARAERRRRRANIAGVAGLVALVAVVALVLSRLGPGAAEVDAPAAGDTPYGLVVGSADAPRQVVVYEDFLCPFCGELEARTHERLAELAAAGEVRVDYRPFQLLDEDWSAQALNAFRVVWEASGPEVALAFHDALYADQPDEGGPFPDLDDLVRRAVAAGADEDAVRPGIEGDAQRAWAEAATAAAADAGVDRTPTVLVDGRVFDAGDDIAEMAAALLAEVG